MKLLIKYKSHKKFKLLEIFQILMANQTLIFIIAICLKVLITAVKILYKIYYLRKNLKMLKKIII